MRNLFRAFDKENNRYVSHFECNMFNNSSYRVERATGKHDRNGKMIFENDIIVVQLFIKSLQSRAAPAVVRYYDEGACFMLFTKKFIPLHEIGLCEIIGNANLTLGLVMGTL